MIPVVNIQFVEKLRKPQPESIITTVRLKYYERILYCSFPTYNNFLRGNDKKCEKKFSSCGDGIGQNWAYILVGDDSTKGSSINDVIPIF